MRLLQMHHLAGLPLRLLWLIEPGNPVLHIVTALEQIGALLPAIFTATTQLLERVELRRRLRLVQLHPVELDEKAVAERGDDFAGAVMLMVSAIQDQEHANDRVCCGVSAQSLVPFSCEPIGGLMEKARYMTASARIKFGARRTALFGYAATVWPPASPDDMPCLFSEIWSLVRLP
jgi:hypothetical protein